MEKPVPPDAGAVAEGAALPPSSSPSAIRALEEREGYGRAAFGLWCLDLFENMVGPPREAAAIERFEQLGQAFQRVVKGQFSPTFATFTNDGEERMLVEGPDHRILLIEDILLFTKTSDGFLDPREELKVIRKRAAAQLVILKVALRFARSSLLGLSIDAGAGDGLKRLALLLREDPEPEPASELKRLQAELKRRDIGGVQLITREELVTGGDLKPAARLLLTLLKRGVARVPAEHVEAWAGSFTKIGGPAVVSDLVLNVDQVLSGPQRDQVKTGFVTGMSVQELQTWRDALEKMGEQLAARLMQELDPARRKAMEAKLLALPKLLQSVVQRIPPEELEKETEKRREKFLAQQEAKVEEQVSVRASAAMSGVLADPDTFLARYTSERDATAYRELTRQCVDAFPKLATENLPLARRLAEVMLAHRKDRSAGFAWRPDVVAAAFKALASERMVRRFVELASSTAAEERQLARQVLGAMGEAALLPVLKAFEAQPSSAELQAVLRDLGAPAEAMLAARVETDQAMPVPLLRVALELMASSGRATRFDLALRCTKHADAGVRELAFRAMAATDPPRALPLLKRHFGDRDLVNAAACIRLLGEAEVNDPHFLKQLVDTVRKREKDQPEPDDRLQVASLAALASYGNLSLPTGPLEELLMTLVKPAEKKLLGFGGGKQKEKSPAVRAAACEALGQVATEKGVAVLRQLALEEEGVAAKLTGRQEDPVKVAAREALKAYSARVGKKA